MYYILFGVIKGKKHFTGRKSVEKSLSHDASIIAGCAYFDAERYEPCHHIISHNNKYTLL